MSHQNRHRIFIAVNLPGEIKKVLAGYEKKWADLPARWTPKDNLHITLLFLGDINDLELGEVCMAAKEVAQRHQAVEVMLTSVGYGPDNKMPPRMVWARGTISPQASELKRDLEEAIMQKIRFKPEGRGFAPHITLARINGMQWRMINPEERPEIPDNLDLMFTAESIEVMESALKRGGPEYTIIESIPLA